MRTPVSYVTWQQHAGRAEEISAALGGRAVHVHSPRLVGSLPRTALRFAISTVATAAHLARRRPRAVIATNPPVVPGLVATAYGALTGAPVVLDSHPTSFGAKDHAVSRRLLPVHAAMARRAAAVMVTTQDWVRVVEGWGGRGLVVHEAPPAWEVPPRTAPTGPAGRPQVLFVGVFASDEPVDVVVEAARLVPEVDVAITGDVRRCPPSLRASLPPNARLTGFLGPEDYRAAVAAADVLLVLTTEPTSVVRAGYEAVHARRPLVVTGTPVLREVFPSAVHTENTAAAVAEAVRTALAAPVDDPRLEAARTAQRERWAGQLSALRRALGLGA